MQSLAGLGSPHSALLYENGCWAVHLPPTRTRRANSLATSRRTPSKGYCAVRAEITYRKTKRMGKVRGSYQAPDFFMQSEFNPKGVIEAKLMGDVGTAWTRFAISAAYGANSTLPTSPHSVKRGAR